MKFSIITATYNSEAVITSCMASVLSQDYANIEYIIIDGVSTDNTINIIKSYQKTHNNIKLISEPDQGIYDALNKGIKHATGDVIGFVHSDDFLASPSIISTIITLFKTTNSDGVYGDLQYVNKHDTTKVVRHWESCGYSPKLLKQGWMPAHPTLFLKSSVYKTHGSFNLNYKIAADYDFILRVFGDKQLQFSYLPQVITKMRTGGASNQSIKNIIKKTKEDYRALKTNKVGGFYAVAFKNISKIHQFYKK